jgi:hypothetical protein
MANTIFVYQRDGNRNSSRMDIRNRATGLARSPFLILHRNIRHRSTRFPQPIS